MLAGIFPDFNTESSWIYSDRRFCLFDEANCQGIPVQFLIGGLDRRNDGKDEGCDANDEEDQDPDGNDDGDSPDYRIEEHGDVKIQGFPGMRRDGGTVVLGNKINDQWKDEADADEWGKVAEDVPEFIVGSGLWCGEFSHAGSKAI